MQNKLRTKNEERRVKNDELKTDHATPEHGTRTPFDTKKEAVSKKTAPLL